MKNPKNFCFKFIVFFLIVSCQSLLAYKLSACAIFQNEGRFLKEWIDYHLVVGVEHFYLYNSRSTDNYLEILSPYIDGGIVTLKDWYKENENVNEPWPLTVQVDAYTDAINTSKDETKWLAIIDLDEFIVPLKGNSIVEILEKRYSKCPGVDLKWLMFGTSDIWEIPQNYYSIELLTKCAHVSHNDNNNTKIIVQPKCVASAATPHVVNFIEGKKSITIDRDIMRINHYWTRDEKHLYEVKIPRYIIWGKTNGGHGDDEKMKQWVLNRAKEINTEIRNFDIQKFIPMM